MAKRGRQVLLESLLAHGVDHIFGNPGTTESPLIDALPEYPAIRYITALHEGVAVGAASFYAKRSISDVRRKDSSSFRGRTQGDNRKTLGESQPQVNFAGVGKAPPAHCSRRKCHGSKLLFEHP